MPRQPGTDEPITTPAESWGFPYSLRDVRVYTPWDPIIRTTQTPPSGGMGLLSEPWCVRSQGPASPTWGLQRGGWLAEVKQSYCRQGHAEHRAPHLTHHSTQEHFTDGGEVGDKLIGWAGE